MEEKINRIMKIVITGPESTGKTTLAHQLAAHFGVTAVEEYCREFLNQLGRSYTIQDLPAMARGQQQAIEEAEKRGFQTLIADTDALSIAIWGAYKYGEEVEEAVSIWQKHFPDLYLLCAPDLDWEPDALRENPEDREELYEWFEEYIESSGVPYAVVYGIGEERLQCALDAIGAALERR